MTRSLYLDLRQTRGLDWIATYGDSENIVSDRAKTLLENYAPGTSVFTPIEPVVQTRSRFRYYEWTIRPCASLACPPTRVPSPKQCAKCGIRYVNCLPGELAIHKPLSAPVARLDVVVNRRPKVIETHLMSRQLFARLQKFTPGGLAVEPAWIISKLSKSNIQRIFSYNVSVSGPRILTRRYWYDPND